MKKFTCSVPNENEFGGKIRETKTYTFKKLLNDIN